MKTFLTVSVAFLCFFVSNPNSFAVDDNLVVSKPCLLLSGANSYVSEPGFHRICSLDEWAKVWQEHKGHNREAEYDFYYDPLGLPVVDFSQFMVITIFEGKRVNNAGMIADSIVEDRDSVTLRFERKTYGTDAGGRRPGKANRMNRIQGRQNVYGFFVIPKSDKQVVIEEKVYQSKDASVADALKPGFRKSDSKQIVWNQRFTFDAIRK